LTSITIGGGVELGEDIFGGFEEVYNNGKQAGTYTFNNGVWTLPGGQQQATAYPFKFADGTITGYFGTDTAVVIPSQIQ